MGVNLFFDGPGHCVGAALADLFIVAKDGAKIALDIIFEASDGDHIEIATRIEAVPGVAQNKSEHLIADFGRQIGSDQVKTQIGGHVAKGVAQVDLAVAEAVALRILARVFDSDKVPVDQVNLPLRCQTGQGQTDRAVATAKVETCGILCDL